MIPNIVASSVRNHKCRITLHTSNMIRYWMDFRNGNSLLRVLLKTPLRFNMITFTYFKWNASYAAHSYWMSAPQLGTQESSDSHRNKAIMSNSSAICFLCFTLSATMHNESLWVTGCSQSRRLTHCTCFVIREQGWFEVKILVILLILSQLALALPQDIKPRLSWLNWNILSACLRSAY